MRTQKTLKWGIGSVVMLSCFMSFQHTKAQTWSNAGSGHHYDRWTVNDDNSNHWSHLRLQVGNTHAWNVVNQGDLWWGYAANGSHSDRGTEKMRLTNDGTLLLKSNADATLDDAGIIVLGPETGTNLTLDGNEILARNNGAASTLHLQIDGGDMLIHHDGSESEKFIVKDDGEVGIGTTNPSAKLHVAGTGYFSNSVGIGITGSSTMLDVAGTGHFSDSLGIGIAAPQAKLHVKETGSDAALDSNGLFMLGTSSNNSIVMDDNEIMARNNGAASTLYVQTEGGDFLLHHAKNNSEKFIVKDDGDVGIGTTSPSEKLEVNGTVKATSFTSSAASFPDYVFAEDYNIRPLSELESYVKTNKRLPNMPSEKEVVEQGLNMPKVLIKSVENIETIYLHLIRMEKEIKALQQENANLKQQLKQRR